MLDAERRKLWLPDQGVEIAILDWGGAGPLALLHHANGFCAGVWGPVAEGLRSQFRVVAMDVRGHGDSSKPTPPAPYAWHHFARDAESVAEVLLAEGDRDRVALGLGHSFGGSALLGAAASRPGLFERLVLLDPIVMPPPPVPGGPVRPVRGHELADGARKRRQVWPDREAARSRWIGKPMFENWDPRAFDLYLSEGMCDRPDGQVELKCSGEVEASIFEQGGDSRVFELAADVSAPTRIVWAKHGDFPRLLFEQLADRLPEGSLSEADTGHLVPMEKPAWVVRHVLEG